MPVKIIRKISYALSLVSFSFFAFCTQAVVNIDPPTPINSTEELINSITNWLLGITSGIVILFMVYGGIVYITASGDNNKLEQGKKIITYCIIGLFLILISYSVVLTLNSIIFG